MIDTPSPKTRFHLQIALIGAGLATLLTAFGGLNLFLAGSLVLGIDLGTGHPANVSLPAGLFAHGPLGYATWMALLMACGAPVIGIAVFAMLYFGRPNAN